MALRKQSDHLQEHLRDGIFVHLGYNDHANNEQLVQALGNAIYQGFEIKKDYPAAEYLKFMEEHKNEH